MNPSMAPPCTSAEEYTAPWGPPSLTGDRSWNGRMHAWRAESGTHTVGMLRRLGMPSAPGYIPKYESNDRFSCMTTIT